MNTVKVNKAPMRRFQANLAYLQKARAQVGYLANDATRDPDGRGDDLTNADIAFIHEFGYPGNGTSNSHPIPMRSTIIMPLSTQLTPAKLAQIPWSALVERDGAKKTLKRFGVIAEDVMQEAYNTGGFGEWPELSPWTVQRKGSTAILIETAQLRQSISSRVVDNP